MKNIVNIVTEMVVNKIIESTSIDEASGFDTIFDQLKLKLKDISILPDNVIDVSKYKEHEIIDSLKSIGYEYKKPMSGKLHFFNKKTSISLYLIQNELKITLMP
jgi:hypothetical protein